VTTQDEQKADPSSLHNGQFQGSDSNTHWSEEVGRRAPNIITLLRLLAVPVFVFLLVDPTPESNLWATVIFIFASLTDWLDGYIARLYHAESILGTLLDPLADKILVMAALVMLTAIPSGPRVAAWMVVVLLARELIVTGLRSLAAVQGTVVPASRWAKHKTACTLIAVICLLIDEPFNIFGALVNFHVSGTIFLWIALALSVGTGIDYAVKLRRMFV
jgi:CDP-diacylglycerol---glycerol-3-phosphate 3-phosphatidyltransferase